VLNGWFWIDLFGKFNESEVDEALRRCSGCGRFVLIGPPRSGKTFLMENHLRSKLGKSVAIEELIPGITITAKAESEEARGGQGLREKVMKYLEGMMPWIKRLRDSAKVDVEELRKVLGDRAPRPVVEGARMIIGDSSYMAYYIPWRCAEKPNECTVDADVIRALGLIREAFGDRSIRWFKAEYVPPGLVKEVINLIKERGEDGAKEVLKGWVEAYAKADESLRNVLGLGEDLLEWDENSAAFLSSFVNKLASYVIGGLAAIPISAAALALVSVLTYMAFKREKENYVSGIIELRGSLERLRRPDGEFNELGKLLVYRVAYAMGMSYDDAEEALMNITGLSIDELKRTVEEIGERVEKLEKKFELFRQEVPAGIVTADVGEFAKGRIYPNIKVENGKLRVRVEDEYHNIVKASKFNELISDVKSKLTSDGLVVVVGPKGTGKSTLAAAVIWELFMDSDIGLVARVDRLGKENYSKFVTFVENYGEEFSEHFGRLLILYDPVSSEVYEKVGIDAEALIQTDVERTVNNLIDVVNARSLEALRPLTLIVLPSDIYNALSNDMRAKLESHSLDAAKKLINTEFLAELVREYTKTRDKPNGCESSNGTLGKLAGDVVKFDSGHALIARLIGEELARNNCDVDKVEELVNKAKGKAEAFIILHINGLFKVHENPDTAKALVEVFALRRPFVDLARPGNSILSPGVVKLMGVSELSGWLAIRQHDLIEEAIKKLLDCIVSENEECRDLGDALEPWVPGTVGLLREVSEKVSDISSAIRYFASNYGEKLTSTLKVFSNKCWKRAALIIGLALAGYVHQVPRPEVLPSDVAESLGDALGKCGVDDYLLVGDEIPPLIMGLAYIHTLTRALIDKYDDAVAEVRRVLGIARDRGSIYYTEGFYGLGLASIIAKAVGSGKRIEPSDADAALDVVSFFIQRVTLTDLIMLILSALEPLRGKAPHKYIVPLAYASNMGNLNLVTVRYIFKELNETLDNLYTYGDAVREHAWSLVHAVRAYSDLLVRYPGHFNSEEVKDVFRKVADLLNELGRSKPSLGVIAWAYALLPALDREDVRVLVEGLGINVVDEASKVLGRLSKMKDEVQELMKDKEFRSYVGSNSVKIDEEAAKKVILQAASFLKHALARYKLRNDELEEAERLFNEVAKEYREIGDYVNYLIARSLALYTEAIKGPLVGDELTMLCNEFQQLYEETFNKELFMPTAQYLDIASDTFGNYLVSLALTGNYETISKLPEERWRVLNADKKASVLTRLTLNALLGHRVELSGELKGKLRVSPEELIDAFGSEMLSEFLPALRVALGIARPGEGAAKCMLLDNLTEGMACMHAISVAVNDDISVVLLREGLINRFQKLLSKKLSLLKELGVDADALSNEFIELMNGLNGKSLVQLIAPADSQAQLALMLHALINGDEKLAKAQALLGAVYYTGRLLTRLFLEVYEAWRDLNKESFGRAVAKLFFSHV
jgi:GTPase SAR1 family protein